MKADAATNVTQYNTWKPKPLVLKLSYGQAGYTPNQFKPPRKLQSLMVERKKRLNYSQGNDKTFPIVIPSISLTKYNINKLRTQIETILKKTRIKGHKRSVSQEGAPKNTLKSKTPSLPLLYQEVTKLDAETVIKELLNCPLTKSKGRRQNYSSITERLAKNEKIEGNFIESMITPVLCHKEDCVKEKKRSVITINVRQKQSTLLKLEAVPRDTTRPFK